MTVKQFEPAAAPVSCPHGSGFKRRYPTRREAECAAWGYLARRGCWLRAYHCHGCGGWHLTSWAQQARDREGGQA